MVGIRVEKLGKSANLLKKMGFVKCNHANRNNVNGFDLINFVGPKSKFDDIDWSKLSKLGFSGVAVWFTDSQWKHNSPITEKQWSEKAVIE